MEHHFRHTVVQASHLQDDLRQYLHHYLRYVPHARQLVNQYRDAEMRRMSMTPTTRVPSIVAYPVNLNVSLPGVRVNIVHRMFGENDIEDLYPHYHLYPHVVSLNREDPPEPPPRQPSPSNVRAITEEKIVELLNRDIISLSQKVRILASRGMFLVVLSKHSQVANATDMAVANNDICSVCLSEVEISSVLRRLRCDHTFHQDCIDRWLLIYLTCPLCRRGIMGNAFEVNETLVDEEDFEPFEVHSEDASDDGQDDDIEAVPLLIRRRVVTPPPPASPSPPRYFQPLPGPHVDMDGTRFYLNPDEEAAGPSHTERRGSGFPSATASYVDLAKPGPSHFNPNPLRSTGPLSPNLSPIFSSDDEDDDISTGIPSPPQEQDWNKRKRLTLLIKKKEIDSCQDDSDDETYTSQVFEDEIPIRDDDERSTQPPSQTEDEDDIQLIEPTPPPLIEIDDDDDVDRDRVPHGDKRKWDAAMGYDQSSSGGASYRNDDDNSSGRSSKRRAYDWDDNYTWPTVTPDTSFSRNYSPSSMVSSVYRPSTPPYSPTEQYMAAEQPPVPYYIADPHHSDDFFSRPVSDFFNPDQGNGSSNSVNSSNEREAALSKAISETEDAKPNLLQAADLSLAKSEPLSTNIGPLDNQGQSFYCFDPLPKKFQHSLGDFGVNIELGSLDFNSSYEQLTVSPLGSDGKQSVIEVLDSDEEDNSNNNSQRSDATTVYSPDNPRSSDATTVYNPNNSQCSDATTVSICNNSQRSDATTVSNSDNPPLSDATTVYNPNNSQCSEATTVSNSFYDCADMPKPSDDVIVISDDED